MNELAPDFVEIGYRFTHNKNSLFGYIYQFILHAAQTDTFGILELIGPLELDLFRLEHIYTGRVNCNGIGGTEYSEITGDAAHGMGLTIAAAGDIQSKVDVDVALAFVPGISVFHKLFAEKLTLEERVCQSGNAPYGYRMMGADGKTRSAADALFVIYAELFSVRPDGVLIAAADTGSAAAAEQRDYPGLDSEVHCHLTAFGGKSHTELLYRASESGEHVALEVGEHQHLLGFGKFAGDGTAFKMFEFDLDLHGILSGLSVVLTNLLPLL